MSFFKLILLFSFSTYSLLAYPNYSQAVKEKKLYPMGKKIYKQKCKEIDSASYKSYEELYRAIADENLCNTQNKRYMDAVSLYLWDKTRRAKKEKVYKKLTVNKTQKCPVCGMFLYKYPEWVTQINYESKSFAFDGVKDMFKFYFQNKEGVKDILVQDYYSGNTIDATKAFFVIGSDIYGPMGYELIPFKTLQSAKRFNLDHRGKNILKFSDITPEVVYKLDE